MENTIFYWALGILIASYIIQKYLLSRKNTSSLYEKELNDILTKDEYKVKGRFEE
ncbi:hypothetical protein HYV79_04505 [Candidatus Woesearchaeota archaeon]|nr:hypothetical protein [Candidatus Woesearchaeota archaeon]